MNTDESLLEDTAEDLFENAPCGYLATRLDGTIIKVNRTFESWTGFQRQALLAGVRFQDLLAPGDQIYHETHYAPLLQMQGSVSEIAVEVVRADGTRLPALINSVLLTDDAGRPRVVRTTVIDATDRRRYEKELLRAGRQERETARALQRSMLSGHLPTSPRVELEVAYHPADEGLEIGGDWYDAFWLSDEESIGLVVGDVVGRGIGAAATMGQLRSAVRALASTGLAPGELLDGLEAYVRRHEVGGMATVVYAQLQLGTGRLRYACAGHPPPVVVTPSEGPRFAWEGRSLPLDAIELDAARPSAECFLEPGSLVLLYTDGLIESRVRTLPEGMDRLLEKIAADHAGPLALVETLARGLRDPEHPDDVCLLAARLCET